ncbi:MAG: leucine--tRNA ligase [Candidatus Magasanikbacteria bacterium CG10_big_fil_rev_8_21_14_0_10_36_32]|uniref:Leucine--tRNA ligase n=1 Tax=Candidatus Magasanikbacteria bacterium CG10_big_fil_rev_8_21_14_0_10_36_32 TaxID=1974646 RepID=A0A2M6W7E3_9BACT|nr:MAG: leucine--tRNA ligase [Candidatus Magasanikbacteria bacterium CG10_big_fil_rev_8_21_14_0_10_36_32]
MTKYNHLKIEKKWQKLWSKKGVFKVKEDAVKPKYYVLDMFPYPSGAGLHVGHPKGYIATDVVARMKQMQGFNVLHPMGWDAFGLPAENYAIQNKIHPAEAVKKNVATFKKQLELLGFTYDWDKEINTTDPAYYKWTQWIFLQMFKKGLAYESFAPINWCPSCQTGLANEDLEEGKCERCGSLVEQKPIRQWVLKITDYAERLLNDLDKLKNWPEAIKEMQKNWIGRSEGADVDFKIKNFDLKIKVFTTRPDTLFGATYCVIAPEHELMSKLQPEIGNWQEVSIYIEGAKHKTALERTDLAKNKTGIELKGIKAINPVNNEELTVFVADYILAGYGTGAIMAVPAHDSRDYEFAVKYGIPIKEVVVPVGENQKLNIKNQNDNSKLKNENNELKSKVQSSKPQIIFEKDGIAVNSGFLDGLPTKEAKEKMIKWLEDNKFGERKVNYKLRDWVFSRQRFWGEPIPLIKCEKCGWVPVSENDLPVELPKVKSYTATGTGESPLSAIEKWVNTKCPKCSGPAKRETNTMPQWGGSCWYYLRYIDSQNDKALVDKDKEKYWSPVDFYVGGAEHATRHLIYARFWHKFLFDIDAVNYDEPFNRLQNVGLILAEDGRKMSKRWGNVINPDDVVKQYGADAMRVYEMFMGPFNQPCAWNANGLIGAKRFLDKVWFLQDKVDKKLVVSGKIDSLVHQTIKKVTDDIETMRFNTAIAKMMELVNEMNKETVISVSNFKFLISILSPFAPHICEELWAELGGKELLILSLWPKYDEKSVMAETTVIVIQVNGRVRDNIEFQTADISEEVAKEAALSSESVKKYINGTEIKKIIYVKNKLLNIVI